MYLVPVAMRTFSSVCIHSDTLCEILLLCNLYSILDLELKQKKINLSSHIKCFLMMFYSKYMFICVCIYMYACKENLGFWSFFVGGGGFLS